MTPFAAGAAGVFIGVVQAGIYIGFLRSATPPHTDADRGFGDWNILGEAAWLASYLVVSVVLVAAILAVARIPHTLLLTGGVLVVETVVAGYAATVLPWNGSWTSFVLVPVLVAILVALLLVTRLLARRRAARQ